MLTHVHSSLQFHWPAQASSLYQGWRPPLSAGGTSRMVSWLSLLSTLTEGELTPSHTHTLSLSYTHKRRVYFLHLLFKSENTRLGKLGKFLSVYFHRQLAEYHLADLLVKMFIKKYILLHFSYTRVVIKCVHIIQCVFVSAKFDDMKALTLTHTHTPTHTHTHMNTHTHTHTHT